MSEALQVCDVGDANFVSIESFQIRCNRVVFFANVGQRSSEAPMTTGPSDEGSAS